MDLRTAYMKNTTRTVWAAVAAFTLLHAFVAEPAGAQNGPAIVTAPKTGRLKVLFLGDPGGHHLPNMRAKQILPALARGGIDMFYTDDAADLNANGLKQYNALIFYNNQGDITNEQITALLNYVKNGGGLVVLHSASAAFQNSEEYIRLIGASFKSHSTGVFSPATVQATHPVMRGVPEIKAWDETYLHTKVNPDMTVLAVRRENGHDEPWTWVRTYGKGRVFYTASGHGPRPGTLPDSADTNVWANAGFQKLVENAVKWTAGDWALAQKIVEPKPEEIKLDVPLPVYKEYLPSGERAPWNLLESNHIEYAQVSLAALESLKLASLRPGMRAELFAAEPLINNIIDFTWDSRGRMWAVETNDYPNTVLPEGTPGSDRIIILEDTNGDGRADRKKIFVDSMNLATSLVLANGGVYVAQAPHMLFFKDANKDDRADSRQVIFTGFPRNDTHGTISNMRMGFDNQIWGSVGYNGFRGTAGKSTYAPGANSFGSGYFRFPVDGSDLEYVARTNNNTWGFAFSEEGYAFGSTANNNPSDFVPFPIRYWRGIGVSEPTLQSIVEGPDNRHDVYAAGQVRQVDQFGKYTAGAGAEIYTARAFPKEYWNRISFVTEPTVHIVGMFELYPNGSGFIAKNRSNLFASRDEWSAPVQAKVGPEGAVWISDFYSLVAQHNPTPQSKEEVARREPDRVNDPTRVFTEKCCRTGPGAAYETPNRDKTHGRIYKLVYANAPAYTPLNLETATPAQLVNALKNDNMFWRQKAQLRLVERGNLDVLPQLIGLLNDQTLDDLGMNVGALHALWTLEGLGGLSKSPPVLAAVRKALYHPAAAVRRAAVQVLPRDEQLLPEMLKAGILPDRTSAHHVEYTVPSNLLQDANAQVRLNAILAVSELAPSPRAQQAIKDALAVPANIRDPWIPHAIAIAAVKQGADFPIQLLQPRTGGNAPPPEAAQQGRGGRMDPAEAGMREITTLIARHYLAKEDAPRFVEVVLATAKTNQALAATIVSMAAPTAGNQPGGRGGRGGGWPEDKAPVLSQEQWDALVAAARAAPAPSPAAPQSGRGGGGGGRGGMPQVQASDLYPALSRLAARWGKPDLIPPRQQ
jgi:putative membrane-bound dehydrogenase-like protein